jgi:hypothetical protein
MSGQRETIITIKPRNGFTVLPNRTLRDNRLSLKTRAILAIMFSLPEDWDYTVAGLSTICGAGRDAVRSALRELETYGYLTRVQQHDAAGHFSRNEYIVADEPAQNEDAPLPENPSTDEPSAGEPLTDEPVTENPTQQNKDCTKPPYGPPTPPEGGGDSRCAAGIMTSRGDGGPRKKAARRRDAPKSAPDWKPERFAGFWKYYPRGEDKQAAIRAWDRLQPSDDLIDQIAAALVRQAASESWQAGVGIPYASTWLNHQRWTDVPKSPPGSQGLPGGWAPDPEVT